MRNHPGALQRRKKQPIFIRFFAW